MINLDNVDRPAILAEVTAAFYQYEEALVSNNIEALDALFWHDPRTVRLGAGENLYGIEAIRAFRAARPAAGLARDLRQARAVRSGDLGLHVAGGGGLYRRLAEVVGGAGVGCDEREQGDESGNALHGLFLRISRVRSSQSSPTAGSS